MNDCRNNCACIILEGQSTGWCERHKCRKTAHWVELCQTRPDYFRLWESGRGPGQKQAVITEAPILVPSGPGTELKKLFGLFGIRAKSGCGCDAHAAQMDREGPDWCEKNMETILGWLKDEAQKRKLPFVRPIASRLVKLAIHRARKKNLIASEVLDDCQFTPGEADPTSWITTAKLIEDTLRLCSKLPPDIDAVVGIARSGLLPATQIAAMRHIPLYISSVDRRRRPTPIVDCGHGCRLSSRQFSPPRRVLIVDDTSRNGGSAILMRQHIATKWPDAKIETCAVYVHPDAAQYIDFAGEIYACHHFLEWNLFNSGILRMMASDLDGIICDSKTGLPLQWPRFQPVPMIVTGRPKSHRDATEAWLKRHGIRYNALVMGPWSAIPSEERVARWKARVFGESHYQFFIESEVGQAQIIRRLTRKQVLCPAAGGLIP